MMFKQLAWLAMAMLVVSHTGFVSGLKEVGSMTSPTTDENNVVDEGETFTLEASYDVDVQSCTWTHYEPMNEGENVDHDIICTGTPGLDGQNCDTEPRIRFSVSGPKCGIQVADSMPEDAGKWRLGTVALNNNGDLQDKSTEFTIYTYNQSHVITLDEERNEIDDWDTKYNYNDRQNKWEDGESNWESVEFTCIAYGGRPIPTFKWFIENNDNDDLGLLDQHFRVSEGQVGTEDREGMIPNYESTISFAIDDELMTFLEDEQGVDTNPEEGEVRFELNCEVEQGTQSFVQRASIDIRVEKRYDNGNLPADTIGIIVGCVIAVILLICAIALLVFARNSKRWCFAEEGRQHQGYHQGQPQQTRTQHGGYRGDAAYPASSSSRGQQQQQQYQHKQGHHHSSSGGYSSQQVDRKAAPIKTSTPMSSSSQYKSSSKKPISESTSHNSTSSPPTYRSKETASSIEEQKKVPYYTASAAQNRRGSSSSSSDASSVKVATAKYKGEWIEKEPPLPPKRSASPDSSRRSSSILSTSAASADLDAPPLPAKQPLVNYTPVEVAPANRRSFMNDPRNQVLPTGGSGSMIRTREYQEERIQTTQYSTIVSSSKYV